MTHRVVAAARKYVQEFGSSAPYRTSTDGGAVYYYIDQLTLSLGARTANRNNEHLNQANDWSQEILDRLDMAENPTRNALLMGSIERLFAYINQHQLLRLHRV